MFSQYFLPNTTFYETNGTYINTQGFVKKVSKIISPIKSVKNNLEILRKFINDLKKITFTADPKLNKQIEFNCKDVVNLKNFSSFLRLPHQHLSRLTFEMKQLNNQSFKINYNKYLESRSAIYNTTFKKQIDDFYIGGTDNYAKSSLTMTNCSNNIRKSSTNF